MHDCSPAAPTTASSSYKTIISFNEKPLFLWKEEQQWKMPFAAAVSHGREFLIGQRSQVRQLEGSSDGSSFFACSVNYSAG